MPGKMKTKYSSTNLKDSDRRVAISHVSCSIFLGGGLSPKAMKSAL
jgi:hypothetical protein